MNLQRISKLLEEKGDLIIHDVILNKVQKEKSVIHGAKAYNLQSPTYLKKQTYDYDILSKKPKKSAKEIAEILKRRLRKDVTVVKGKHKGTYKIKIEGRTIADFTQLKKKPKTKKVWGIEARDIKSIKRNAQRLIKRPNTSFRREKDIDTLNRIKEIERIEKLFRT